MSDLARNEQTKLLSNALDRASTGCLTVGIATPLAALFYNIGNFGASIGVTRIVVGLAVWLFAAIPLHIFARRILKGLRE
jgi:hypothetical protein